MRRLLIPLSLISLTLSPPALAQENLTGDQIIEKVNAREDGEFVTRNFTLELKDRKGNTRIEETVSYRRYFGDEKRTIVFYTDPNSVRGTGFLTYDYADPTSDDDQWLYLPALRKVRRISASDRGDYFLGTDFTYEEIKKEQKVEPDDYIVEAKGREDINGRTLLVVEGVPANETIADELGVSKVIWKVDPDIWMSRQTEYYDRNGNHARTITLEGVDTIDGYVTTTQMHVLSHKTGHSTRLTFSDTDYKTEVPESMFTRTRLQRGL